MRTSAAVRQLRGTVRGTVLAKGDTAYDAARRIWNGAVDVHPAVVVRCADAADVTAAVRAAREHDLPLSVRGGGHDWAGRALREGGLVIDLSAMRQVDVDPAGATALVAGGATTGNVVTTAGRYDLAVPTGTVKAVGMVGLSLAGGYGPLNGKHGLSLDNLLGAEVVLADGQRVNADEDLLWALRGGGGRFGVVTSATYRLHRLAPVLTGVILFPIEQAATVLRGYRECIAEAPDELTLMAGFLSGPDGSPVLFLYPAWSGNLAAGKDLVARIERLGTPVQSQVSPMAYQDAVSMFDPYVVNGRHYAIRTRWLEELTDDAAAVLIHAARTATSSMSLITLHHFHGAATRVPTAATAYPLRSPHLLVEIVAAWEPAPDRDPTVHCGWAEALSAQLASHALPGGYPNLLGPDEADRARVAYGANAERLLDLQRRFDPDGVFGAAIGAF